MKKKHLEKTLNALKGNLAKNAVTPEGQALIDEITAILADLANDPDVEYNEEDIMAKVTAAASKAGAAAAAEVASSFENKFKPAKNELDVRMARELFGQALLNSAGRGKGVFKKEFEGLLAQNKITGLPTLTEVFPEIQTKFEKTSILSKLRKLGTQNLNIPVSLQEDDSTDVRARGHVPYDGDGADVAKVDQILTLTPKSLTLGAIYKKISVPKLMSYQTGNVGQLMSWLANELIERIDNELQRVILVGDGRSAGTDKITSFETIGTKTQADAYTVYKETSNALPTLADVRALIDQMDSSKPIVLYAHPAVITNMQAYQYAAGGAVSYITDEILANQIGVAEIVRTKMLAGAVPAPVVAAAKYPLVIAFQPESYGYIGSDLFSVDYEKWDYNQDVLMAEIFAGGGIIKPNASAVLKVAVPAAG